MEQPVRPPDGTRVRLDTNHEGVVVGELPGLGNRMVLVRLDPIDGGAEAPTPLSRITGYARRTIVQTHRIWVTFRLEDGSEHQWWTLGLDERNGDIIAAELGNPPFGERRRFSRSALVEEVNLATLGIPCTPDQLPQGERLP